MTCPVTLSGSPVVNTRAVPDPATPWDEGAGCQWLRHRRQAGLLWSSFRSDSQVCVRR